MDLSDGQHDRRRKGTAVALGAVLGVALVILAGRTPGRIVR